MKQLCTTLQKNGSRFFGKSLNSSLNFIIAFLKFEVMRCPEVSPRNVTTKNFVLHCTKYCPGLLAERYKNNEPFPNWSNNKNTWCNLRTTLFSIMMPLKPEARFKGLNLKTPLYIWFEASRDRCFRAWIKTLIHFLGTQTIPPKPKAASLRTLSLRDCSRPQKLGASTEYSVV